MHGFSDEIKERRQHKLAHSIRESLHEILQREVKDPRVKSLTIMEVNLKPDLRSANIQVCKFMGTDGHEPTQDEIDDLMDGLDSASHFIYEALKRKLFLRSVPSLKFSYDDRMAAISKVWSLVGQATESDKQRAEQTKELAS